MNHYERLAVDRTASEGQIAAAFRRAARRAHPDVGGSAEEFAAIEEARRVLCSADLRAAYDAQLDGVAVPWDLAAWGEEVPLDPDGGAAPSGPRQDPPPDDADPDLAPATEERREPPIAPASDPSLEWLSPYEPGAVRLPDTTEEALVLRVTAYQGRRPTATDRRLRWVLVALAAACAVAAGVAATVDTALLGLPLLLITTVGIVHGLALTVLYNDPRRLGAGAVVATGSTIGTLALVSLAAWAGDPIAESDSLHPLQWIILVIMAALTVAATMATSRAGARHRRFVSAMSAATELENRAALAAAWNRLRTALEYPGSRPCVVLRRRPVGGNDLPVRIWDPVDGRERDVPCEETVHRGDWLVLDQWDDIVCLAPAGSVEAWASLLGVDQAMLALYPGPIAHGR